MFPFTGMKTFPTDALIDKEDELLPHEVRFGEPCCDSTANTNDVVLHCAMHSFYGSQTVSHHDEHRMRTLVYKFLHSAESAHFHCKHAGFMKYSAWKDVHAFRRSVMSYTEFDNPLCLHALAHATHSHIAVVYRHCVWNTCANAQGVTGALMVFAQTDRGLRRCVHAVKLEMCEVMCLPLQAKCCTLPSASVGKVADDDTEADVDRMGENVVTPAQGDVSDEQQGDVHDDVEEGVAMKVEPDSADQAGEMIVTPAQGDVRDERDDVVEERVAVKVEPDDVDQAGEMVSTPAQHEHPPIPLSPKVVIMRDGVATDVKTTVVHEPVRMVITPAQCDVHDECVEQVDALPKRGRRST